MFVPFITPREPPDRLLRRKGGGGGGRGGSSGSSGKGSSGKGSGISSGSKGSSGSSKTSPSISSGGQKISSKSYGAGGGTPAMIPAGQLFGGRMAGGGMRNQVFGTRMYGSGYPGVMGAGVAGRGFPFYFWPVVWGTAAGIGTAAYLHNDEYGLPNNSSRPGGVMAVAAYQSSNNSSTFRIISDNATVDALISDISSNCSSYFDAAGSSTSPSEYNGYPVPEQVIQYYRASSVVLTLDGYNNSAVYAGEGAADSPIPSNTDTALLNCLNQTIGLAAPLSSGAIHFRLPVSYLSLVGLFYVLQNVLPLF
ncbi:hypothetical protein E4T56_gene368 [Termitomyces sp. T112]|nr:hypothetical protein E4T56_gene368 [Termitomyces sp. T112]